MYVGKVLECGYVQQRAPRYSDYIRLPKFLLYLCRPEYSSPHVVKKTYQHSSYRLSPCCCYQHRIDRHRQSPSHRSNSANRYMNNDACCSSHSGPNSYILQTRKDCLDRCRCRCIHSNRLRRNHIPATVMIAGVSFPFVRSEDSTESSLEYLAALDVDRCGNSTVVKMHR